MELKDKPTFQGYGTPFVAIYDSAKQLIRDKIPVEGGELRDIAFSSFSYTFNEEDDDNGSITLWSDTVEFLNNFNLRHNGILYIAWGYLGGDERPPLRCIIRNIKESYTSQGYKLIIELSDNYAPSKLTQNPLRAKLEETLEYLTKIDPEPSHAAEKLDMFLHRKSLKKYNPDNMIVTPRSGGPVVSEVIPDAAGEGPPQFNQGYVGPTSQGISLPPGSYDVDEAVVNLKVGAVEVADAQSRWDNMSFKDRADFLYGNQLLESETGKDSREIYASGNSPAEVVKDTLNQAIDEPVGVSGSDGEVKIFKKKKVALFPPIREYTFKGGNGRLLDFNYDSDATYDDDSNVLRTLRINPETGAIEQKDYAGSAKKLIDAYDPIQYQRELDQARLEEALANDLASAALDPNAPMEVINLPDMMFQFSGGMQANGGWLMSRDGSARVTPRKVLPITYREEAIKAVENELKNFKAEAGLRNRATARILGDPGLSHGYNILFKGLSKRRCGSYHITSCTHTIDQNQGYIVSVEMYKVSDVPESITTVSTTIEGKEVKQKAEAAQTKKLENLRLKQLYDSQGYILSEQIKNQDYYKAMQELDKDWVSKVGYIDYKITYIDKKGVTKEIVVRVTNDPRSDQPQALGDFFNGEILWQIDPEAKALDTTYKTSVVRIVKSNY